MPLSEFYFPGDSFLTSSDRIFIQNLKGTNQTFELSCSGDIVARHEASQLLKMTNQILLC